MRFIFMYITAVLRGCNVWSVGEGLIYFTVLNVFQVIILEADMFRGRYANTTGPKYGTLSIAGMDTPVLRFLSNILHPFCSK